MPPDSELPVLVLGGATLVLLCALCRNNKRPGAAERRGSGQLKRAALKGSSQNAERGGRKNQGGKGGKVKAKAKGSLRNLQGKRSKQVGYGQVSTTDLEMGEEDEAHRASERSERAARPANTY